jgi:hypothetical protein
MSFESVLMELGLFTYVPAYLTLGAITFTAGFAAIVDFLILIVGALLMATTPHVYAGIHPPRYYAPQPQWLQATDAWGRLTYVQYAPLKQYFHGASQGGINYQQAVASPNGRIFTWAIPSTINAMFFARIKEFDTAHAGFALVVHYLTYLVANRGLSAISSNSSLWNMFVIFIPTIIALGFVNLVAMVIVLRPPLRLTRLKEPLVGMYVVVGGHVMWGCIAVWASCAGVIGLLRFGGLVESILWGRL